jgi:hypothetical protein
LNILHMQLGGNRYHCGSDTSCVIGYKKGFLDITDPDAVKVARHEILHYAGLDDQYEVIGKDVFGHRIARPKEGFTEENVMASSRKGNSLTKEQLDASKEYPINKQCSATGDGDKRLWCRD